MIVRRTVFHAHAAIENLGDRLVVEAVRETLRAALPDHTLVFEDASPAAESLRHRVRAPLAREARRAIESADLALLGGGELIGPFREYLGVGLVAAAAGVPAVWLGVGGAVAGGRTDRVYTRFVLRCAEAVVTRGPHSFERLRAEVPDARLHEGVDVAFGWTPPDDADDPPADAFGICLRGPERRDRLWDGAAFVRLARQIDAIAARGLRPVFLTFLSARDATRIGSPNLDESFHSDAEVHAFVRKHMRSEGAEELVVEGDLTGTVRRLRTLRFLIGMRLHSLVLATQCGVPFLALDYAPKIAELTDVLGCGEWRVRPEEVDTRMPALAARLCLPAELAARAAALRSACETLRARALAQLASVIAALDVQRTPARRRTRRTGAVLLQHVAALHARL
ncbi:MAG: polysaccharide pyruvyl transferase family protein [Deltaproteobacteria bacterium]|nr:polysaccharide pyruvyl transferase family protein [Deltaproteobacteria bacterium]